MGEFLLELFSEEIPARMQRQAAKDLERLVAERLQAAGLAPSALCAFAGPRRLTLVAEGLPPAQPDRAETRRGPKIGAPEAAVAGFSRMAGLDRERLQIRDGAYYADLIRPGRPTVAVLSEMTLEILNAFPWPKSMRWGEGSFRWVRPLKRILCLFDRQIVPVEVAGIRSGGMTEGHRFMGPAHGPAAVSDFAGYEQTLRDRFVLLRGEDRKERIMQGAEAVCAAHGLELVEDLGLLEEVAGLVEWPTPVLGPMDRAFLDLPPEVIRTSMRTHQKYFAVRTPGSDGLAPFFVVVANIEAEDGGALIAVGNAKVLSARLSDAAFFWSADLKIPLEARAAGLSGATFHARLGTMFERAGRIEALARALAPSVGASPALAATAGRLCKADLATGMVGEFPELQGIMGGYYARAEGRAGIEARSGGTRVPSRGAWFEGLTLEEVDAIADAVRDQYRPQGPADTAPEAPLSVALALAEKLDTLVSFFSIGEKPTGSRDPYALRRAALGIIRLILATGRSVSLGALLSSAAGAGGDLGKRTGAIAEVADFLTERLKVMLREEGRRHDLVDAVIDGAGDDLVSVVARTEALSSFLETPDGASLLAGYRRAVNILKAEAKKSPGGTTEDAGEIPPPPSAEAALAEAETAVARRVEAALQQDDFTAAMRALAELRAPVDTFFDTVLVNDQNPAVRRRRLGLLTRVRDTANRIANFSLVSG